MTEEIFLKKTGDNIVRLRKAKGLKQVDLAAMVNMDDSALRRIEKGRVNATILKYKAICDAMNIDLKDLFDI